MAINTSSTSFKVAWSQVPLEGRNGIVRGFRIEYSEGNILERNISVTTVTYNESLVRPNATVNSTHSARRRRALVEERFSKEFSGLKMFTNYTYRVQAITVSRGEYSAPRVVTTDEDGEASSNEFTVPWGWIIWYCGRMSGKRFEKNWTIVSDKIIIFLRHETRKSKVWETKRNVEKANYNQILSIKKCACKSFFLLLSPSNQMVVPLPW